jgi:S1-C subfamily serine protease
MEKKMNEPSISRTEVWRGRLRRFGRGVWRAAPFFGGIVAAFAGLILYNLFYPAPRPLSTEDVSTSIAQVLASVTPPPAYSETVYQIIQPSLVLIQTKGPGADGKPENGLGSGVIIDDSGDIMTSLHVVTDTTSIKVTFADGSESSAQIATQQPQIDIAILKADNLPAQIVPAVLGNPSSMRVGDEAYVVGNPFGLYSSMSAGVISGFNRSFQPPEGKQRLEGLIQIDTAVNPGNSGGPLLNRAGQVIGIVEGIVNPTGQDVFIGIGFAVPINVAGGAMGSPID